MTAATATVYTEAEIEVLRTEWHGLFADGRSTEFGCVKLTARILRDHKNDSKRCATFLTVQMEVRPCDVARYLSLVPLLKKVSGEKLWKALSPSQLRQLAALDREKRQKLANAIRKVLNASGSSVLLKASWKMQYEKVAPPSPKHGKKKEKKEKKEGVGVNAYTRRYPLNEDDQNDLEYLRYIFGEKMPNENPALSTALSSYLPKRALDILRLPISKRMKDV